MGHDDIIQDGDVFAYSLRVPKDRVAVFIGPKGSTKKRLREDLDVELEIESREGEVIARSQDSLKVYTAKDVLKAIARGFNPDVALLLLKQDYVFEVIDVTDNAPSKDAMRRLKGRVIGFQGKSWKTIEQLTDTYMAVYGKTVCIIGDTMRANAAKRAVEALLGGSQHAAVYKWLEKQRRSFKAEF